MFEWSNRTLVVGALLALVIVVFGFLPAADAAACAPEARADVASSSISTSPDHETSGDLKHGVCAHGHCHHGSTGMQPASILVPANLSKADDKAALKSDLMASRTPAGPDRPPRV